MRPSRPGSLRNSTSTGSPPMAVVELAFTPLPAHVRTARLVAVAVARRSGVADSLLDEVRLAVGEACSRAVEAHRQRCPAEPVEVVVTDSAPGDAAPRRGPATAGDAAAGPAGGLGPAASAPARAGRPLPGGQ